VKGNVMERKEGKAMIRVSPREHRRVTSDISTRCLAYDDRSTSFTSYVLILLGWIFHCLIPLLRRILLQKITDTCLESSVFDSLSFQVHGVVACASKHPCHACRRVASG
jgi:hypothetical protein